MTKKNRIQIFCDSADLKIIKKLNNNPLVKGFTTNPSLMKNSGAKTIKIIQKKFLKFVRKNLFHLRYFQTILKS